MLYLTNRIRFQEEPPAEEAPPTEGGEDTPPEE